MPRSARSQWASGNRVLALQASQLPDFPLRAGVGRYRHTHLDQTLAHLLAPFRQHERVNLQGVGDVLNQHAINLGELDRLELELGGVLPDPIILAMQTSSSVRPECLLYRGNICVRWNRLLGAHSLKDERTDCIDTYDQRQNEIKQYPSRDELRYPARKPVDTWHVTLQ